MDDDWDREAWDKAKAQADKRFPLPEQLPGMSGVTTAILASMLIGLYVGLDEFLPRVWAGLIAAAIAGLMRYLDDKSRFDAHVKEEMAAYEYFKRDRS